MSNRKIISLNVQNVYIWKIIFVDMINAISSTLPMFVCLFWFILLLTDRQQVNLSKRFLILFFGLSFINYFSHAAYFNQQYRLYTVLDSIWCFTSLAAYPLYYLYIRLLTTDSKIRWKWSLVLIPSLLVSLFSAVTYILMSPDEVITFVHGILYFGSGYEQPFPTMVRVQIFRMLLFKIVFVVQVFIVIYFGLQHIIKYNARIKDFYSDTDKKDLSSMKWLLIVFIFASLVSVVSSGIGKTYFFSHHWLLFIPSFTHALFLYGVGYAGYKQNFTIEHFQQDINQLERISMPVRGKHKKEDYRVLLIDLLENKEIFAQSDLRITDLTKMLNTNRTYTSRLLNEVFQTNFADLINKYRIKKSDELLRSDARNEYSMEDIASMSGFSSLSSFYRSFKKEKGMTPGDFKKKKFPDSRFSE